MTPRAKVAVSARTIDIGPPHAIGLEYDDRDGYPRVVRQRQPRAAHAERRGSLFRDAMKHQLWRLGPGREHFGVVPRDPCRERQVPCSPLPSPRAARLRIQGAPRPRRNRGALRVGQVRGGRMRSSQPRPACVPLRGERDHVHAKSDDHFRPRARRIARNMLCTRRGTACADHHRVGHDRMPDVQFDDLGQRAYRPTLAIVSPCPAATAANRGAARGQRPLQDQWLGAPCS